MLGGRDNRVSVHSGRRSFREHRSPLNKAIIPFRLSTLLLRSIILPTDTLTNTIFDVGCICERTFFRRSLSQIVWRACNKL